MHLNLIETVLPCLYADNHSVSQPLRLVQDDGCPPAKRRRVHAEPQLRCSVSGAFQDVPPELLRRILGFLSAHDLCAAVARACRGLRCAAADDVLWRRLYKARYFRASSC